MKNEAKANRCGHRWPHQTGEKRHVHTCKWPPHPGTAGPHKCLCGAKTVISATQKVETSYCIPTWLRDLQIEAAIKRVAGRILPHEGPPRPEPIAVVCFGPSLNDTWEQIKDYQYVISCSGSHKFLVERGIVPTWQVEVDPRPHKVQLIGQPQKETQYLIASTCHAAVFDHLEGYDVRLWHVFDMTADALRMLPQGDWAVTGGCSVGLRAMTLAAFLGFRDLQVFGMDGCEGTSGKHADVHPNQPKGSMPVEYKGHIYQSTAGMLAAAQQTAHELDQMPKVRATFHGEGLVQAMMADHVYKEPSASAKEFANIVGFVKPPTISEAYRQLNADLHASNLAYGVGGGRFTSMATKYHEKYPACSILDYGCGKGLLAKSLPFPIWEYDPAIPGKQQSPRPADLVMCNDVLEHIEPEHLDAVLADLARCVKEIGYFTIHTGPSGKVLADGRNTHLIQEGEAFWRAKLERLFLVRRVLTQGPVLHVEVLPYRVAKVSARKVG